MIHLYTGEGKGKTSAAIGLSVRAAGWGCKVCFAQFMKGNDTGELHVLEKLPNVAVLRSKKNFGFYRTMSDTDKAELAGIHNRMLDKLLEMAESGAYRVLVLDEVTYPVNWKLLDGERLKSLLELGKSGEMELVLTGRGAEKSLRDAADYLTEMVCLRHPFERGVEARRGIEF